MIFAHVLVATDFGDASRPALDLAVKLACEQGARLTVVNVYEPPAMAYAGSAFATTDLVSPVDEGARAQMASTLREIAARCPTVDGVVRHAIPAEGVLATAREVGADLIVVGTHGRHGVGRVLLGSVAETILRDADVPVLVVRATA